MNLIKTKGIVIKEVQYKDNDKIITILTDKLGKISCIAKGAKKNNSSILASSQYLVYSEFVLYRSNNFYYVNSATLINSFYNLKIDLDKLNLAFELTKLVQITTSENEDTIKVLNLLLNTLYILQNMNRNVKLIVSTFKIKLLSILGFTPRIDKCSECGHALKESNKIYYDFTRNIFLCDNCIEVVDRRRIIEIAKSTLIAINYVVSSSIKKVFSFELKDATNFELFSNVYADTLSNGI